jgi:hypothetical protein
MYVPHSLFLPLRGKGEEEDEGEIFQSHFPPLHFSLMSCSLANLTQ